MSLALYRKYRSKSLGEIVGQTHITDILARAIKNGRISHAYLFTGPRGVGKTSIARILAHEINGLPYSEESTHLDIIEIDAASNNGVEDVRDLREKVQIAPVSASKKVYIIDEVHMLSKAAFNALLKTLEEPPAHVVFILATTDADKLPATIISRTQRYGFRAIGETDVVKHLGEIAKAEGIKIDEAALKLIAERGDGSFRDSISLLDQLAGLTEKGEAVTLELIEQALGLAPKKLVDELLKATHAHDIPGIAKLLAQANADGVSAAIIAQQLISTVRTQAGEKPQLLNLLDHLLDVPKSAMPDVKLLTVLGLYGEPKHRVAALEAPVLEVSATIEELTKQATKKHPVAPAPTPTTKPAAVVEKKEEPVATAAPEKPAESVRQLEGGGVEFNWDALIEHTRKNYVALFSVLSKCKYDYDGSTLLLYTNSAFYKKKLDDAKYSTYLYDSLKELGHGELTVDTIPAAPPPKDSQAAAVAAIMGGGEEVSIGT